MSISRFHSLANARSCSIATSILLVLGCTGVIGPTPGRVHAGSGDAGDGDGGAPAVPTGGRLANENPGGASGLDAGSSGGAGGSKSTGGGAGGSKSTGSGGSKSMGSGGKTSMGGATGSGGSTTHVNPPPPVQTAGKCDNLKPSGTWEYIFPWDTPHMEGASGRVPGCAISLDPYDAGTLWAAPCGDYLWKSTDCGSTWTKISTGTNANAAMQNGGVLSMVVDPVAPTPGIIYVAPIYGSGGVWRSRNGGVDWEQTLPDMKIVDQNHFDSVSIDPTDHLHLVAGTHGGCAAPYAPACEAETTDGGDSWRFVKLPTNSWEEGAGPWVIDAHSWVYAGTSGLYLTTDNGGTWSMVGNGNFQGGEVEIHPIQRGPDGTYYLAAVSSGVFSSPDGHKWGQIPNSQGRYVGLVVGDKSIFVSDQWSGSFAKAPLSDTTKWSSFTGPPMYQSSAGCPYVEYDRTHHLLYASCYGSGMWRTVIE